jgi:four helix bundle protein
METKKNHIQVQNLDIYKSARELSRIGWEIYESMDWQTKKVMGDQFITATDSFGANIVEGYSRYHFLDKIKFMYNGRGSLSEAKDWWLERMLERQKVKKELYEKYRETAEQSSLKLQNFINAIYKAKDNNS